MTVSNPVAKAGLARSRRGSKRGLALGLGIGAMLAIAVGTALFLMRPVTLRVAVGPPGSDDAKLIQSITQAFARERAHVRLFPVIVDEAQGSVSLLADSKVDLAISRADVEMPTDAQSVAVFRKNVVVLWTAPAPAAKNLKTKAKIKGLDDLAGHRVGMIGKSQTNVALLKVVLEMSGVTPDKVGIVQYGIDQVAEMLRDQTVDVIMAVGPLNSKITADAIALTAKSRGEPAFLSIDVGDAIAKKYPLYESEEIPGSSFSSSPARPANKIDTVGVNHLIIARQSLSEYTVGAFTRQLFAVRHSMLKDIPGISQIETPDTDKDAVLPAHRGAASYIDGTERTFLEKYSDFIWGGLFIVSGLGSVAAWLRRYFKRDDATQATALRLRLVEMIDLVRRAKTLEELDQLQLQADEVPRELLIYSDDGGIDDGVIAAFTLVFEQFNAAVANQTLALKDPPPQVQRLTLLENKSI